MEVSKLTLLKPSSISVSVHPYYVSFPCPSSSFHVSRPAHKGWIIHRARVGEYSNYTQNNTYSLTFTKMSMPCPMPHGRWTWQKTLSLHQRPYFTIFGLGRFYGFPVGGHFICTWICRNRCVTFVFRWEKYLHRASYHQPEPVQLGQKQCQNAYLTSPW